MKPLSLAIALIVIFAILIIITKAIKAKSKTSSITKKQPLTKNEQPMYFRLTEALPEYVVLAQVAFSALLKAKDLATRNQFDRKVADFVICTKAFEVIAVVELDDSSHKGKEDQDNKRDLLLTSAGYVVKRYKRTPNIEDIRRDFATNLQANDALLSNANDSPAPAVRQS
ncbi:DUF2726 domain-containing protein [Undibacterium curvum]|uniref:DUF2726 domain-containing protein n=1 Tax=Undibacterium curvum TaxID=2762294 RepID=UPI003D14889B